MSYSQPLDDMVTNIPVPYLLTPTNRVLLEKLTVSQQVKKFPTFYGTRRFITASTSASTYPYLSQLDPINSSRSRLILRSYLRLGHPSGLLPSSFPTKTLYMPLLSSIRGTCSAHLILLDLITRTIFGEEHRSLSSSLCIFLHSPVTSSLLGAFLFNNEYNYFNRQTERYATELKAIRYINTKR